MLLPTSGADKGGVLQPAPSSSTPWSFLLLSCWPQQGSLGAQERQTAQPAQTRHGRPMDHADIAMMCHHAAPTVVAIFIIPPLRILTLCPARTAPCGQPGFGQHHPPPPPAGGRWCRLSLLLLSSASAPGKRWCDPRRLAVAIQGRSESR